MWMENLVQYKDPFVTYIECQPSHFILIPHVVLPVIFLWPPESPWGHWSYRADSSLGTGKATTGEFTQGLVAESYLEWHLTSFKAVNVPLEYVISGLIAEL